MLGVLAFAIFFIQNFKTVVVSGPSMMPTLRSGDRILASKAYWLVGGIRRKDIVVIKDENATGYIIKRVVFLPGETVDFYNAPRNWPLRNGPFVVPADSYYVLGDNREVSEDSRIFGPVDKSRIIGKVVVWP